MRPEAYIARFDSSITSSHPPVGTISSRWRLTAPGRKSWNGKPARTIRPAQMTPLSSGSAPLRAMISARSALARISVTISTR
jgi:hypothetical protein